MPLLCTLLLNGMLGAAGYWSARYTLRLAAGMPRVLGAFTLAWAWATLGMEILGWAGLLGYRPLLAWATAGLVLAALVGARRHRPAAHDARPAVTGPPPPAPAARGQAWEVSAIAALGLVIWVTTLHGLNSLLGPVKVISDGPIYHLYFAARWWKAGRLFIVPAPFGETVVSYFPAVGELWFTWLMVGWGGDLLAKVGQLPFLIVAGLAAYGSARRLGAGVAAAVIATCWFLAIFPFLLFTLEGNVDTIFVAGYLLAAYFFLGYSLGDGSAEWLALGALALGGVLGTKPTGIVFGGLLIGAAVLAVWLRRTSTRQALGHLAVLALLPLVMAGAWYGHNILLTGNPLYPLHLEALGRVWLAGWYGSGVMRQSPYYIAVQNWRACADILSAVFDPRQILIWVAAVAVAVAGAWRGGSGTAQRRPGEDRLVGVFSALGVANLAVYWLAVPYRTQQRFMFQAAGLMTIPLARLFDRGRWVRVFATVLLAVHLCTPQSWPFGPADKEPPWDLSRLVKNVVPPLIVIPYLSKIRRGIPPEPNDITGSLAILALGAASFATAWLWSRNGSSARLQAVFGTLVFLVLTLAVGYPVQSDPRSLFYARFPDYYRGWLQLDARAGPRGARVAYAGTNLPYFLLGVGLRNEVRYVNVDEHRSWLMHDYHRQAQRRGAPTWPTPWPAWDRLQPSYKAWLANLRAEHIDLLVVASMVRPPGMLPDADAEGFPIERRWADAHPESFESLYGVAERDPKFRLYRLRPPRPATAVQAEDAATQQSVKKPTESSARLHLYQERVRRSVSPGN